MKTVTGSRLQSRRKRCRKRPTALYVSKEFIREENGQKFVYIRDENDKLKKQNVVTGKLLWGSYYEVKSGLSEEDYIAFPYGKTVVEGADTKESSSSDYYNS